MIQRNPIWQPWFLAVLLTVGFAIVWGGAVTWCVVLVDEIARTDSTHWSIEVLDDGTPLVRSYSFRDYMSINYETLDGETFVPPKRDSLMRGTPLAYAGRQRGPWFDLNWSQRVSMFMDRKDKSVVYWHLINDGKLDGRSYFVGYDLQSKLCVGYIGRAGFRLTKPSQDDCFPIDGTFVRHIGGQMVSGQDYHWRDHNQVADSGPAGRIPPWAVYLISGEQLVEVDLHERSVRVLLESAGLRTVGAVQPADVDKSKERDKEKSGDFLALRTDREILILDSDGKTRHSYVIPETLKDKYFTFYQLSETKAMVQRSRNLASAGTHRYVFTWFDQQGAIGQEKSIDLPRYSAIEQPSVAAYVIGAGAPAPVVVMPMLLFGLPSDLVNSGEFPDYSSALAQILSDTWPALVIVNLLGVGLAWVCYRRQKQCGQGWTWLWVGFVFLFGLPGLVGYLFHRGWPARQPCPKCNVSAPRDRESCFECREEFPQPAPKGTEVLV